MLSPRGEAWHLTLGSKDDYYHVHCTDEETEASKEEGSGPRPQTEPDSQGRAAPPAHRSEEVAAPGAEAGAGGFVFCTPLYPPFAPASFAPVP